MMWQHMNGSKYPPVFFPVGGNANGSLVELLFTLVLLLLLDPVFACVLRICTHSLFGEVFEQLTLDALIPYWPAEQEQVYFVSENISWPVKICCALCCMH